MLRYARTPPCPPPRLLRQAAQIPGDRVLLDAARDAASQLLAAQPDPRAWGGELLALVADEGLIQLDTHEVPSLG